MRKSNHTAKTILISLGLLTGFSSIFAQKNLDPEEERTAIESRDALYSQYQLQGDSVAIANIVHQRWFHRVRDGAGDPGSGRKLDPQRYQK